MVLFVRFLHLFFAFGFVGALVVAEWNSRAARRTGDWSQRAMLWEIVRVSGIAGGIVSLVLLGVLGHVLAFQLHYPESGGWMRAVNLLWMVELLLYGLLCLPHATRLARIARGAAGGGAGEAYAPTLRRWRIVNLIANLLYLVLLAMMVMSRGTS